MARFESGWQIFGFLLGAAFVSVAVIQVLKLEAAKRYGNDNNSDNELASAETSQPHIEASQGDSVLSFKSRLKTKVENFLSWFNKDESNLRVKRSIASDLEALDQSAAVLMPAVNAYTAVTADQSHEDPRSFQGSNPQFEDDLTENILTESFRGRKIRHLREKVLQLGRKNPLVEIILEIFCVDEFEIGFGGETTTTETIVLNPRGNFSSNSEDLSMITKSTRSDDFYQIVFLTTICNYALVAFLVIVRSSLKLGRRKKRNIHCFTNNYDEIYEKEIFKTETSQYSPVVKPFQVKLN